MDEATARLELVKQELSELQQAIRSYDALIIQIKSWAVTVGLASAGLAVTADRPGAALLGIFAACTFWALEAHRRSVQDRMIRRVYEIETLFADGITKGLSSAQLLPGLAHALMQVDRGQRFRATLRAALLPGTGTLYVALIILLLATVAWLT